MKITYPKWGKVLALAIFFWGSHQGWAQAPQQNWQAYKTPFDPSFVEDKIKDVCMPIDARVAKDGHSCYILQRQCWLDNSGYGPCIKNGCKYWIALAGPEINAGYATPTHYMWYCDMIYNGTAPPSPAVMPPDECKGLGEAWLHRIASDPACAHQ